MTDPRLDAIVARTVDVPDFPKPGILFKDLTPVFADPTTFGFAVALFTEALEGESVDLVVGVEARGFILAAALANHLGVGFVPVRKPGKLPRATFRETYALEYGTDTLELHRDAIPSGAKVALVDDVLATGGTAAATARLLAQAGATTTRALFLLELGFLGGRAKLAGLDVRSLVSLGT